MVKDDLDFSDFDEVEPTVIGVPSGPSEPPPEDSRSRRDVVREWLWKHRYAAAVAVLVAVMLMIELAAQFRAGQFSIPFIAESESVAKVIAINGDTRTFLLLAWRLNVTPSELMDMRVADVLARLRR